MPKDLENKINNALQILLSDELMYLQTVHGVNGMANRYKIKFPGASGNSTDVTIFDNDGQNFTLTEALAIARTLIIQKAIYLLSQEVKAE